MPHADLVVVLGAAAAAASVQLCVLLPYLCVAAVTGSDPAEELLHFGAQAVSAVTAAVAQVLHNGSDQDLKDLQTMTRQRATGVRDRKSGSCACVSEEQMKAARKHRGLVCSSRLKEEKKLFIFI